MAEHYDVIVIGSGGGVKIALPAAARGLRTALVEASTAGGTCLNRGCIPSKMLIYPAETADRMRDADRLDVVLPGRPEVRFGELVSRITETIEGVSSGLVDKFRSTENLDYVTGQATFTADRTIRVGARELTADRVFIATGSEPVIPELPGLAGTPFMTSREALRCTELPGSLIVIGAGYIAAELGYAYAAAGADVTFIVRSRFLRAEDEEVAREFERVFRRRHAVVQGLRPVRVEYSGGFAVLCRGEQGEEQTVRADALLIATGVRPCSAELSLDNTGVQVDARGFIVVDDCLRTGAEGVYACGDVIGRHFYRHTVNYEGEYLVRTAFTDGDPAPICYGPVPHAVFTHPEIAGVGATEQALRESGTAYVKGVATYADSTPGMARRSEHGLVKVLFEAGTHRLLGAHIVGDEAATMIHLFIAMMKQQGTLEDLLDTIFIHPALPEVARDAVRDARDRLP